jgi:hypothetical protein
MVAGTSATWKPRAITPISSSAAWYWGCSSWTSPVTSARMARRPKVVSEIRWPVSVLMVRANTRTPSRRSTARLSSLPMVRDPVQKSASPATTGASTDSISAGLYCPSASVVTM